jgi:hypothetical protein
MKLCLKASFKGSWKKHYKKMEKKVEKKHAKFLSFFSLHRKEAVDNNDDKKEKKMKWNEIQRNSQQIDRTTITIKSMEFSLPTCLSDITSFFFKNFFFHSFPMSRRHWREFRLTSSFSAFLFILSQFKKRQDIYLNNNVDYIFLFFLFFHTQQQQQQI